MPWLDWLRAFGIKNLSLSFSTPISATGYRMDPDEPQTQVNRQLTTHFSLYELTATSHMKFQYENRRVSINQLRKLVQVARLLEEVRALLGVPLIVHSGYRCPDVNKAVGSTDKSQHLLCEAADFSPEGAKTYEDHKAAWDKIRVAAEQKKLSFGQLILEEAGRDYGTAVWVHISLGSPYRPQEKDNEVLTMQNGKYVMVGFA